jgi:hypothetical protein
MKFDHVRRLSASAVLSLLLRQPALVSAPGGRLWVDLQPTLTWNNPRLESSSRARVEIKDNVGPWLHLEVTNNGNRPTPVHMELVFGSPNQAPDGTFRRPIWDQNGTVNADQNKLFPISFAQIPSNAPLGPATICAYVSTPPSIRETNLTNNFSCVAVTVAAPTSRPYDPSIRQ